MRTEILTKSATQTKILAVRLAQKIIRSGRKKQAIVLALSGNLGSGKTTFVQGFARGLGIKTIPKSPTFILIQMLKIRNSKLSTPPKPPFRLRRPGEIRNLIHIDAYRLDRPKEFWHLGLREMLRDPHNIILIEWAEKIKRLLPPDTVWLEFKHLGKNERVIRFKNIDL